MVALAGIKGTSTSTSRTGIAGKPNGVKYVVVDGAGEMQIVYDYDKLAYGAIIITFTDSKVIVVKSGDYQLKITAPDGTIIFVDFTTTVKALLKNLTKTTEIKSAIGSFNPNGISAISSPEPIVVPR